MGGQACLLYGAAEFSRDTDFAILSNPENLEALSKALTDLKAERIFLPPLEARFLEKGHAIHFRCGRADVEAIARGCHGQNARSGPIPGTVGTPDNRGNYRWLDRRDVIT